MGPAIVFPVRVAAIDVGSNAIRYLAAEFLTPGRYSVLESERVPVRLGQDVFLTGRLTPRAMTGAAAALTSFRQQMEALEIRHYRAVTTSAVRESTNGKGFVRRVRRETGLVLETITGFEEARLVHLAVRCRLANLRGQFILADLGGGSVEVSLIDDSGILWSESHTMGSVRLLEELTGAGEDRGRFRRLLSEYISTLHLPAATQHVKPAGFIATGGSIETLAKLTGTLPGNDGVSVVPLSALRSVIDTLARLSYRQRVEEFNLREDQADVILPAAVVYERLAVLSEAGEILVPHVGIKEGLVLDLMEVLSTGKEHEDRRERQVREGALGLGRKFMFDEKHAVKVAQLTSLIFEPLRPRYRLAESERLMLLAAAVLHDIGTFVSYKKHHKHSFYLISQSELPGFSPRDILLIAMVARYHRKGDPNPSHEEFARLTEAERNRVMRLAAILRVADALDREHLQTVQQVQITFSKKVLGIRVEGAGDLLLERWAMKRKAQLLEKVFQVKIELYVEKGPHETERSRAR